MKKNAFLIMLGVIFIISMFSINNITIKHTNKVDSEPVIEVPQKPTEPYGFDYLDDWQKNLYLFIDSDLKLMDNSDKKAGYIYNFDDKKPYNDVIKVLDLIKKNDGKIAIVYNYNEISENLNNLEYYKQNIIGIKKYESIISENDYNKENDLTKTEAMKIIGKIPDDANDFEKVKIIHDEIIKIVQYYNPTYDDVYVKPSENYNSSANSYGALVNKYANCQGYSDAFKYVANLAGLYSITITGYIKDYNNNINDTSHAWNMVWINGNWYHLDLTWDDAPSYGSNDGAEIYYSWFLLNYDEIKSRNRYVNEYSSGIPIPEANNNLDEVFFRKLVNYQF